MKQIKVYTDESYHANCEAPDKKCSSDGLHVVTEEQYKHLLTLQKKHDKAREQLIAAIKDITGVE